MHYAPVAVVVVDRVVLRATVVPEGERARAPLEAAVAQGQLHEIKSSIILQPGPAALTDGVREIQRVFRKWESG